MGDGRSSFQAEILGVTSVCSTGLTEGQQTKAPRNVLSNSGSNEKAWTTFLKLSSYLSVQNALIDSRLRIGTLGNA